MTTTPEQISQLLHEAGETHHRVFRIVDGADEDWASWYGADHPRQAWESYYAQRIVDHFSPAKG